MISASQDPVWGESGSGGFAADGTTLGNPLELPKNLLGAVPGGSSCLPCSTQSDIALSPGWGQCQPSVTADLLVLRGKRNHVEPLRGAGQGARGADGNFLKGKGEAGVFIC
ncbi:hypothetical protein DV515_00007185 [Chloebia gouldiae]|uniref:Uncharacterized protein n=1 Tax=Chloebia gouldiae TaxID=44316 RepID=A0A3L8SIL0_CHLGU|nr:hypothetical protein DV515_00007185 [Chloebia gouldiae]